MYIEKNYFISKIFIKIIIGCLLIILICLGRENGCFSQLKYTNLIVQSKELQVIRIRTIETDIFNEFEAYPADEAMTRLTQKYIEEISQFAYQKYNIIRDIPEYNIFISDKINYAVTVVDEEYGLCVIISNKYMQFSPKTLHPIIIHELFHVFNAYDGKNYINYNGEIITSYLIEGYTDILTDEFCEYYGYNYYKRCDNSKYKYCCYLTEIFLINDAQLFQDYYFNKDVTFAINFDRRLTENAKVSQKFDVLSYYERNLEDMFFGNEENIKEKFLATLEITLYYLKSEENTLIYEEYLNDIFKWYDEEHSEYPLTDKEKKYMHSLLTNSK